MPRRRPKSVTLFAGLVLIVAVFYLIRFFQAVQRWDVLEAWLPFSPAYLAGTGLVWAIVGIVLVPGIWMGRTWTRTGMNIALGLYEVYYWGERLWLTTQRLHQENWLFMVLLHSIVILWWAGIYFHSSTREFFGVCYAGERENQTTA